MCHILSYVSKSIHRLVLIGHAELIRDWTVAITSVFETANIVQCLSEGRRTHLEIVKVFVEFEFEKDLLCIKIVVLSRVVVKIKISGVGVLYVLLRMRARQRGEEFVERFLCHRVTEMIIESMID